VERYGGHPPDGKKYVQFGRESRGLRVELRHEPVQEPPLVESRSDVSIQPTTAEERGEKIQELNHYCTWGDDHCVTSFLMDIYIVGSVLKVEMTA
jgi:hypothetical protein